MLSMSLEQFLERTINTEYSTGSKPPQLPNLQDPDSLEDPSGDDDQPQISGLRRWLLRATQGAAFQVVYAIVASTQACVAVPIVQGLQFDELMPSKFLCRASTDAAWAPCTREAICEKAMAKNLFTAVRSDPEYLHNWVEHFDMLCEPAYKIALLGSANMLGMLITALPVPMLADMYGRKPVLVVTEIINLAALLAIRVTHDINVAYLLIGIVGMCFAGRCVVGLTLIAEYMPSETWRSNTINFCGLLESLFCIVIYCYYKFIGNDWEQINLAFVVVAAVNLLIVILYLPESPQFLYTKGRYEEARASILTAASFNGVTHDPDTGADLKTVLFEKESALERSAANLAVLEIDSSDERSVDEGEGLLASRADLLEARE